MKGFEVFSDARRFYPSMIRDIRDAKYYIYLETYIYDPDEIGKRFRDILIKKAKQGVKVRVLVDSWGSKVKRDFFKELIEAGGEVRFFREFRYVIRVFSKNHERNHRKLLLIDNYISYMGSANITSSGIGWRELVLRFEGGITEHFVDSFQVIWETYGDFTSKRVMNIFHKGFEIIHDMPADRYKLTQSKYVKLIKSARDKIMIETPYFIPPKSLRKALGSAVRRGVKVMLVLPYMSDVGIADIMRNRYLGSLYRKGVCIYYYLPKTLHSKLLIVDDKIFLIGTSNLDYRSFVHQFEINLLGKNKKMLRALKRYFEETLKECKNFNYSEWRKRSSFNKILEIFGHLVDRYL